MEESNTFKNVVLVLSLLGLSWILGYYILGPMLYGDEKSTEPCGCGKKGIPPEHKKLTENDITPDKRACIAVGLCDAKELFGFNIIPEVVHKWQSEIIHGANKIFGTEKSKKATHKSGKKSTGRKK